MSRKNPSVWQLCKIVRPQLFTCNHCRNSGICSILMAYHHFKRTHNLQHTIALAEVINQVLTNGFIKDDCRKRLEEIIVALDQRVSKCNINKPETKKIYFTPIK